MTSLLDVNVLIALAWPTHTHHRAAHAWFDKQTTPRWASCLLTQTGFVRISSNARVMGFPLAPAVACGILREMTADPAHTFWPTDFGFDELLQRHPGMEISGHRQVSDAYLLASALEHDGQLVTLDAGIPHLAGKPYRDRVVVLGG